MVFGRRMKVYLGACWLAPCLASGCTAGAASDNTASESVATRAPSVRSTLEVVALGDPEQAYALTYTRGRDAEGPRVVEIVISHPGLSLLSAEAGPALEAAGKELTVQKRSGSQIRLVALSTQNVSAIDTGTLATLRFTNTGDADPALEILADRPVFAPQAANEGLLIGEPLHP